MDYKLAKQLKEAGFPEIENGNGIMINSIDGGTIKWVYSPSLSELIDRIDCFQSLHSSGQEWEVCDALSCSIGKTRLIAAAKLYIELSKK